MAVLVAELGAYRLVTGKNRSLVLSVLGATRSYIGMLGRRVGLLQPAVGGRSGDEDLLLVPIEVLARGS